MINKFIPLDCDDILLIEQDTFQISRLKELVEKEIRQKLNQDIYNSENQNKGSMSSLLSTITINEQNICIQEIQFCLVINCQLLKIGEKSWQKGNIKIQISTSFNARKKPSKIDMEFFPDELEEIESPLDDIKQMLNNS